MKPGQFFKLLIMCFPLMYGGSLIGNMLAALLSGGKASNSVSDLAMQFDVWNVVFLVILGPLFEDGSSARNSSAARANTAKKPRSCSPHCSLAWCT